MTGQELQDLLDRIGVSQRKGARISGIAERTMRKYIAGELPVSERTAKLLRLIEKTGLLPDTLD